MAALQSHKHPSGHFTPTTHTSHTQSFLAAWRRRERIKHNNFIYVTALCTAVPRGRNRLQFRRHEWDERGASLLPCQQQITAKPGWVRWRELMKGGRNAPPEKHADASVRWTGLVLQTSNTASRDPLWERSPDCCYHTCVLFTGTSNR